MKRPPSPRHILARKRAWKRGASAVEYLMVLGLVAIVAMVGVRAFGATVHGKIDCMADRIGGDGSGCPDGQPSSGFARGATGGTSNPSFGGVKGADGASYTHLDGQPFVTGVGDGSDVHPSDITQGGINDCYVLSPLAELALRDPDSIRRMVKDNHDGTFTVTLYEKNNHAWWSFWASDWKKVEIKVNADFPTKDGHPVFAQPGDSAAGRQELWAMLVEKAYAQYKGGYAALDKGGLPGDPLTSFTGKSSDNIPNDELSFDHFHELWQKGDAMTGATLVPDAAKDNPLFQPGGPLKEPLVAWHIYYVVGVDKDKQTVTLRNPWGWDTGETTLTWDQYRSAFVRTAVNPID